MEKRKATEWGMQKELHSSILGRRIRATAAEKAVASDWESEETLSLLWRPQVS